MLKMSFHNNFISLNSLQLHKEKEILWKDLFYELRNALFNYIYFTKVLVVASESGKRIKALKLENEVHWSELRRNSWCLTL